MISYVVSVVLSWVSLFSLVWIHASRIMEGRSLGVFGVVLALVGFFVSLLFYVVAVRSGLKIHYHLAYWVPVIAAIVMSNVLGMTFAP